MLVVIALLWRSVGAIENVKLANSSVSCEGGSVYHCLLENTCIPLAKKCDGVWDCQHGADELFCGPGKTCDQFLCKNGRCISLHWRCDGQNDCMDFSDEEDCAPKSTTSSTCPPNHFRCNDGLCIPNDWVCDGADDCHKAEDESAASCAGKKAQGCKKDQFQCADKQQCIPHRWLCDGSNDCIDKSDEGEHCGKNKTSDCNFSQGWFACKDGSRCIEGKYVCDGVPQCKDKSDEGFFCANRGCPASACSQGCLESEQGPKCFCRPGYVLAEDGYACVDVNECKEWGSCSQLCTNSPGSFKCDCAAGYVMINNSCIVTGGDVIIYLSTEHGVRSYDVRSNNYDSVIGNLHHVIGVGYDSVDKRVYWTDVKLGKETIESVKTDGRGRRVVLSTGLGMPEDLVVDETSRNIYFSDSGKKRIGVCKLDGSACAVVTKDVEKPRGLAIHVAQKLLIFSDWGSRPLIVRMGLDGADSRPIVQDNLRWPNGIAVDQISDRVYWSDAHFDVLESVKIDGTDRRLILKDVDKHPFGLAVFEDTLYWSDWSGRELISCNKYTGKDRRSIIKEPNVKIMGITVSHPSLFRANMNPCSGAPCSHVCLPKSAAAAVSAVRPYTCACPPEMQLGDNGRTCRPAANSTNSAVIVGTAGELFGLQPQRLGRPDLSPVTTFLGRLRGLTADSLSGDVFANLDNLAIYRVDTGRGQSVKVTADTSIAALAYDSIDANLYWIDTRRASIHVQSLRSMAKRIIMENLTSPTAIVFLDDRRQLIVADGLRLLSARPDGSAVTVLADRLAGITSALAYAPSDKALYLAHPTRRQISRVSLERREPGAELRREQPVTFLSGIGEVADLTVNEDLLYWMERGAAELFWVKMDKSITRANISWMSLIEIANPHSSNLSLATSANLSSYLAAIPKPCLNSSCDELCFSYGGKAVCSCAYGRALSPDGLTCLNQCPENTFRCGDDKSRCISRNWMCDKNADCDNGADESNCTAVPARSSSPLTSACSKSQYRCPDGECLTLDWKCDGDLDCTDGADENDCPPVHCHSKTQFQCANKKKCILAIWRCDGSADCEDGSDEKNCPSQTCTPSTNFMCADNSTCIQRRWVCDGSKDCRDGSDEANCTEAKGCSKDQFKCANGLCISTKELCDKQDDCGDGSDELPATCHYRVEEALPPPCEYGLLCGLSCLPMAARCNGTVECMDESDEDDCAVCNEKTWTCADSQGCVPGSWRCDGAPDCRDGSDEIGCPNITSPSSSINTCSPEQYTCSSGECIELTQVCDSVPHCADGSDEDTTICRSACSDGASLCPVGQICRSTPRGPACACHPGYNLVTVNGSSVCEDIDECSQLSACAQICSNTKGGHKCFCAPGYVSEFGGKVCRSVGERAQLMFASGRYIKGMDLPTSDTLPSRHYLYVTHTQAIKSFDFNRRTGEIFWSCPSMNMIGRHAKTNRDSLQLPNATVWLSNVTRPEELAVDWLTGNLYFTQAASPFITVCNRRKACLRIIKAPVSTITRIALDPNQGRIFVAGYKRGEASGFPQGRVWVYGMDGSLISGVQKLSGPKLGIPSGLTLDPVNRRVYWIDRQRATIHASNYNATWTRDIVRSPISLPTHLAFFESILYWLGGNKGEVAGHHLLTNKSLVAHSIYLPPRAHGLRLQQEQLQRIGTNPCRKGDCSHICLITPSNNYKCACPTGLVPKDSWAHECMTPEGNAANFDDPEDLIGHDSHDHGDGVEIQHIGADHKGTIIGITFAILVVIALTVVGMALLCYFTRAKRNKTLPRDQPATGSLRFSNNAFGLRPAGASADSGSQASSVKVVKRGSVIAYDNPGFDSPAMGGMTPVESSSSGGRFSKLEYLKYGRAPKLASMDWPDSANIGCDSPIVAKGSSTPTMKRRDLPPLQETDSAYTEPSACIDYDDLSDQHISVSFHKDKARLLDED